MEILNPKKSHPLNVAKKIKIAIFDNHKMVAESLEKIFTHHNDYSLVGTYCRSSSLCHRLYESPADIILLDYALPVENNESGGARLVQKLGRYHPESRIVVISSEYNLRIAQEAFHAGAMAFVDKGMSIELLFEALASVINGQWWAEKEMKEFLNNNPEDAFSNINTGNLTPCESEVITYFARGLTVTSIALHLNKSVKTASGQKQSAFKKLGVESNQDFYRKFGIRNGWQY